MTWVTPLRLADERVALEPLALSHSPDLAVAAADGEVWTLWYTSVPRPEEMSKAIEQRLAKQAVGAWLPFAVIDLESGRAIGMTSYLNIVEEVRRLEIGGTWYRRSAQGTGVNVACKRLLLAHAFEPLHCVAVELRTHRLNRQSRSAIEALGAQLDGILRCHFDSFGNPRDTCVYSIIAAEWPQVRSHLDWRRNRSTR